jgi:hypothetical protein
LYTSNERRVLAQSVDARQLPTPAHSSVSHFERPSRRSGRKVALLLLAGLIVSAMVGWLGFIGWSLVTIVKRLLAQ